MTKLSHQGLDLHLSVPTFPQNTVPNGALQPHLACQACFYYYILAMMQKERVGRGPEDQILLEGEPWQDTHFRELKQTIAMLYGITPDRMDAFWGEVHREAQRLGLPEPHSSLLLKQIIIVN